VLEKLPLWKSTLHLLLDKGQSPRKHPDVDEGADLGRRELKQRYLSIFSSLYLKKCHKDDEELGNRERIRPLLLCK
jgi:hypothetical protein